MFSLFTSTRHLSLHLLSPYSLPPLSWCLHQTVMTNHIMILIPSRKRPNFVTPLTALLLLSLLPSLMDTLLPPTVQPKWSLKILPKSQRLLLLPPATMLRMQGGPHRR